jgi:hypothetical protein
MSRRLQLSKPRPATRPSSRLDRCDASVSSWRFCSSRCTGHHDGADQLGEGADAGFGVGRHGLGVNRTHGRQAPHASIDDDGHPDRRVYAGVSYPRCE